MFPFRLFSLPAAVAAALLFAAAPSVEAQGVLVDDPGAATGTAAGLDLRDGDRFLRWRRETPSPAEGWLASPFDLESLAATEGPLGDVVLVGRRGEAELVVRVSAGAWSIPGRPSWSPGEDAAYRAARDLLATDRDAACAAWGEQAARWSRVGRPGVAAWLWRRIARERAGAGEGDRAGEALDRGLAASDLAADPGARRALEAERGRWRERGRPAAQ